MSGIEAYDLGREDGIAEEQERIIKLLERDVLLDYPPIENVIAEIKGETNE